MKTAQILVVLSCLTIPGFAQELPSFRNDAYNPRSPEGVFDLLVRVDGEAIVYIQGANIRYTLLGGAPLQDAGSNYNQAIPEAVFGSFNMEKKAGRGSASLMEVPSRSNNFTAVVRINDRNSGSDLYHLRLDWTWNPADPSRPPGGRYSRPLDSQVNDAGDYKRGRNGFFRFRGRVDDVAILRIRSDQVREEDLAGKPIANDKFEFSQPLPSVRLKTLELVDVNGRGEVELVERPWEGNRFTAVIRITDPSPGNSVYSFRLIWSR